jgi:hypothetical protein
MKILSSFLCGFLIITTSFAANIDERKIQKCIAEYFAEPISKNKYVTTEAIFYFETEADAIDTEEAAKTFAKANMQYLQQFIPKYKLNRDESLKLSSSLYEILKKNDSEESLDQATINVRLKVYATAQNYVTQSIEQFFPPEQTSKKTSEYQNNTNALQKEEQQQNKSGKDLTIGNIEFQEEWITPLLIFFAVVFAVLLLMALSGKVVVFYGWGDLSVTFALAALTIGIAVYGDLTVGFLIGAGAIVISCWQSAKHNNGIILGILVGTLKLLCAIALLILLLIAFVLAHSETEKRKEAKHYKAYSRDIKRADAAERDAYQMALLQKICNGLVNVFISKK